MASVNMHEAKTQLSRLVKRAAAGEEIVISRAGKPVVKLVPIDPPRGRRVLGQMRGPPWIADDFDAPLPDDLRALPGGSTAPLLVAPV